MNKRSDQVINNPEIEEIDLTESVRHFYRIIDSLLEADNLNDSQKGQIESIKSIFGSINKVVSHVVLEEFSNNLKERQGEGITHIT
ncbi:MAG: hypothetical protein HQ538_04565 [Parcubacteria group bacterium]|nr:hypothetical protein [Parcubacteria group bacterium]